MCCGWTLQTPVFIAHKLVKVALIHHVPGKFRDLILDIYSFSLCWVYNLRVLVLARHGHPGSLPPKVASAAQHWQDISSGIPS